MIAPARPGLNAGMAGGSPYHWRTPSGSEVDFMSYGRSGFRAVEVNCILLERMLESMRRQAK